MATAADPMRRTANIFLIVDTIVSTEFAGVEISNSDALSTDSKESESRWRLLHSKSIACL